MSLRNQIVLWDIEGMKNLKPPDIVNTNRMNIVCSTVIYICVVNQTFD